MDWQDDGVILSARPHGETAAILEVFTQGHGRHLGVLPGGASRKRAAMLQPGSQVRLAWRARLDEHIGTYAAEPLRQRAGILSRAAALNALSSAAALLHLALPERQPHPGLYAPSLALFDALEDDAADWPQSYLRWEVLLLEEMGFALDLTVCAVTGTRDDLAFVSPRTGRAVSRAGAGDWASRLLPLPEGLAQGTGPVADIGSGLALTGHFLQAALPDRSLPIARTRLLRSLDRG